MIGRAVPDMGRIAERLTEPVPAVVFDHADELTKAYKDINAMSERFFHMDPRSLGALCFYDEGYTFGFRGFGQEHGEDEKDKPDLNVSFSYMPIQHELLRVSGQLESRLRMLPLDDHNVASDFMEAQCKVIEAHVGYAAIILSSIAAQLNIAHPPAFLYEGLIPLSYCQVNYFDPTMVAIHAADRPAEGVREIQTRHTDGHLLTFAHSTTPGLETPSPADGGWQSRTALPDQTVVMMGDITAEWAPALQPTPHRVVDHYQPRTSIIGFINPDFDDPRPLWGANGTVDLAKWRDWPVHKFGLNPLTRDVRRRAA